MENHANPQSQTRDSVAEETTGKQAKPQPQQYRRAFDALRDAIRKGAEDAKTAAEKAIPKVKSAAADAVYWTAYGVSFAAVFQWTLARGLAPECLKSGFRDGVKGGSEAAERWIEKLRQRQEKRTATSPDPAGQSADAGQPGAA